MYDFHKTRNKDKEKEFKHEYLRKGKPEFLKYIKRKIGDDLIANSGKSEQLLQKFKKLEEKCATYEALARISLPVKKLKLVGGEDCNMLIEGLTSFLDQDSVNTIDEEDRLKLNNATLEYLEKIRAIKRGKNQSEYSSNVYSKEALFESNTTSASLSKRCPSSQEEDSDSQYNTKLLSAFEEDNLDAVSCSNSLASDEFNFDLLDFSGSDNLYQTPFEFNQEICLRDL